METVKGTKSAKSHARAERAFACESPLKLSSHQHCLNYINSFYTFRCAAAAFDDGDTVSACEYVIFYAIIYCHFKHLAPQPFTHQINDRVSSLHFVQRTM